MLTSLQLIVPWTFHYLIPWISRWEPIFYTFKKQSIRLFLDQNLPPSIWKPDTQNIKFSTNKRAYLEPILISNGGEGLNFITFQIRHLGYAKCYRVFLRSSKETWYTRVTHEHDKHVFQLLENSEAIWLNLKNSERKRKHQRNPKRKMTLFVFIKHSTSAYFHFNICNVAYI